jgi:hypothetical protein
VLVFITATVGKAFSYTPPESNRVVTHFWGCRAVGVGNWFSPISYGQRLKNQWLASNVGNVGFSIFLRFLRPARLKGFAVGNVGNTYRFPTFLRPLLRPRFGGAKHVSN